MPWREWPWEKIAALILSPGVPLTHPKPHEVVAHAKARQASPVIGDVELFAREIRPDAAKPGQAPVIAITGTNGKSTTTALIGHILASRRLRRPDRRQYRQVGAGTGAARTAQHHLCAGNVQLPDRSDARPQPDIALLSNLTPDHIDRHGSMENYAAIKQRLLRQVPKDGQVDRRRGRSVLAPRSSPDCRPTAARPACRFRWARCWAAAFLRWMARCMTPRRPRAAKVMDAGRRAAPARRAQLAEYGAGLRRHQAFRQGYARHRRRHRQFPRPGASHGRCGPHRQDASSSMIPRPPMPTPRPGRWPVIPIFSGSRAASPRKAASTAWRRISPVSAKPI